MRSFLAFLAVLFLAAAAHAQGLNPPGDPYLVGKGAWEQDYDDQWAIKRVGFTTDKDSAWQLVSKTAKPVIVAVIDTGLDWNHKDISWNNIWVNKGEVPDNGVDDDNNGYVDDIIGWNFMAKNNKPWDHDGHGTFVAGVIAGTWDNQAGIAGVAPNAKIMVLKGLNNFGHGRASHISKALVYAVDNGARVINLSVGGKGITSIQKDAIRYAHSKGAVIVVASGNEGIDVAEFGVAGLDEVITVGASGFDDERAIFSNWGAAVDLAAPGLDVLSLRARRTDFLDGIPEVEYDRRTAYVGKDKRYYRASGTSFSAPIVSGIAALIIGNNPNYTNEDVKRILLNSAEDIGAPGIDQYTGYGLVDARAALRTDKDFFIRARIDDVAVVEGDAGLAVEVLGTATADKFKRAWLEIGAGEEPSEWKRVSEDLTSPVEGGTLGAIPAAEFGGSSLWFIRVVAEHDNERQRQARFRLDLE